MAERMKERLRYPRRTLDQALSGPPKAGAETLWDGVGLLYPGTTPRQLRACLRNIESQSGTEPELLLFSALLSGMRLGIYRPSLAEVQAELWSWLTWGPGGMRAELADIVIEALSDGLQAATAGRGWRIGEHGSDEWKPWRPPESLAAWGAALIAEHVLLRLGVRPVDAVGFACDLAATLLGREDVEPTEYYRYRKKLVLDRLEALAEAICQEFEWWVDRDALISKSSPRRPTLTRRYGPWRRRHRSLPHALARHGSHSLARIALASPRLENELWRCFLEKESKDATAATVRPPQPFSREWLEQEGYQGFRNFRELRGRKSSRPPASAGIYVVLRTVDSNPRFLPKSLAGRYKRRDPTVDTATLQRNWVPQARTLYIGKADDLRQRLKDYARFGAGHPSGHYGGRFVWQMRDHASLVLAWKETPDQKPRVAELELLGRFAATFGGRLPFANLRR